MDLSSCLNPKASRCHGSAVLWYAKLRPFRANFAAFDEARSGWTSQKASAEQRTIKEYQTYINPPVLPDYDASELSDPVIS